MIVKKGIDKIIIGNINNFLDRKDNVETKSNIYGINFIKKVDNIGYYYKSQTVPIETVIKVLEYFRSNSVLIEIDVYSYVSPKRKGCIELDEKTLTDAKSFYNQGCKDKQIILF